MELSVASLLAIKNEKGLEIPSERLMLLPEKVLQFGTGVLLRGLQDYFIDKANKQGLFNGSILVVKSTGQGGTDAFSRQNNLYTQVVRGMENGRPVNTHIINAAISRVVAAADSWPAVLKAAANPQLQIIISNTTEVGIVLHPDDNVFAAPPVSFPGKLLAFLLERYNQFNGSPEAGMVIIPSELIPENGLALKSIVLELAVRNHLKPSFIDWIEKANDFCNSLVDRIVPGKLSGPDQEKIELQLGYKDELMLMSEVYRLWAIESSSNRTREILSFSAADPGIVIAPDIDKYRDLKLRILNGSHTFSCGLAILLGFTTVKQAMEHPVFAAYIKGLMMDEICPAVVNEKITLPETLDFATKVIERYQNPFLEHQWMSISLQYSSKMKMRNLPLLLKHYSLSETPPIAMALGFAAYIIFMKSEKESGGKFYGEWAGRKYQIQDDKAGILYSCWKQADPGNTVINVLQSTALWDTDLSALPGFLNLVTQQVLSLLNAGPSINITEILSK